MARIYCVAFVCYILHACCFESQGFTSPCLRSLWLTLCQGKGQKRRSVTINPHPSHCAPSLEPNSLDFLMNFSLSLIYQKAYTISRVPWCQCIIVRFYTILFLLHFNFFIKIVLSPTW